MTPGRSVGTSNYGVARHEKALAQQPTNTTAYDAANYGSEERTHERDGDADEPDLCAPDNSRHQAGHTAGRANIV